MATGTACRNAFVQLARPLMTAAAVMLLGAGHAAADDAIEFGILPTLSARATLSTYQPLREHLEERLHRPVTLITAPDFATYVERTRRGVYSFLVTAPHFARLAQIESGYVPMVRIKRELRGLIVVREDSDIQTLAGLRGKIISTPERMAVVSMLGLELLRAQGLEPGRDVTVRPATSFTSAVLAVQNGESAAAITAPTALGQMPEDVRARLRVIASTASVPGTVYMAHPRVPPAEIERMTQLLLEFSADPTRGKAFFEHTGYEGLVRVAPEEMRALDPYVAELKRRLAEDGVEKR